jgi:hypothetical protein
MTSPGNNLSSSITSTLAEAEAAIARIEQALLAKVDLSAIESTGQRITAVESRVSHLEKWQTWIQLGLAVLAAAELLVIVILLVDWL